MAIANDMDSIFVYSEMQVMEEKEINAKIGKIFRCGEVSVGANKQQYSKIIHSTNEWNAMISQYPDTKIVVQGKLSSVSYTPVTTNFR